MYDAKLKCDAQKVPAQKFRTRNEKDLKESSDQIVLADGVVDLV